MKHRKTEFNARRRTVRFVIVSHGLTFDTSLTATLITASYNTVRNGHFNFRTFSVSGRVMATIFLVIALVIRVVSALVIRAPHFSPLLLLIAVFVRVPISMMVRASFPRAVLSVTWLIRLSYELLAIFVFMPRLFANLTSKGYSGLTHAVCSWPTTAIINFKVRILTPFGTDNLSEWFITITFIMPMNFSSPKSGFIIDRI